MYIANFITWKLNVLNIEDKIIAVINRQNVIKGFESVFKCIG